MSLLSGVWADQNHWQEWLNTHIQRVSSLPSVLADQNHWLEWLNIHPESEFALWCFSRPEWLNIHPASVFALQFWADQNRWQEWLNMHPGCEFALQSLKRLEPLMKMAEHAFRKWVSSPFYADQNNWQEWTPTQQVSSSLFNKHIRTADKNCLTYPASELLLYLSRTTGKNGWTCNQQVSCSYIWADQNHWQEWLNTYPECEFTQQCFGGSESLIRMAKIQRVSSSAFVQIRTS